MNKKLKEFIVILTVPHGAKETSFGEDEGAIYHVNVLESLLKFKEINVVKFISNVRRDIIDENRKYYIKQNKIFETRKTNFRKSITEAIKKAKQENLRILLIDVHSHEGEENKKDIYFLDNSYAYNTYSTTSYLLDNLSNYLDSKNITSDVFKGGSIKTGESWKRANDIIDEGNENGIDCFISEINEKKSKERIDKISSEMVDWIYDYYINPSSVFPISGIVNYIDKNRLGFFINPKNDKNIYSPIDGAIKYWINGGTIDTNLNFYSNNNNNGKKSELHIIINSKNNYVKMIFFLTNINNIKILKLGEAKIGEKIAEMEFKEINQNDLSIVDCIIEFKNFPPIKKKYNLYGGKSKLY